MPRLIPYASYDPHVKNALNDVARGYVKRTGDPLTWFSGWSQKTVNIGRDQDPRAACDLDAVREDDVALVRRQGGGGAVYLAPGNEISWSLVTPRGHRADSLDDVYRHVARHLIAALKQLGVTASHEPANDVVTPKGKISGGTLHDDGTTVYTGCTLLYNVEPDEMFTYLSPSKEKYQQKGYEDYRERVTSLSDETTTTFSEATTTLQAHIQGSTPYDWDDSSWTDEERRKAKQLADKYRDHHQAR